MKKSLKLHGRAEEVVAERLASYGAALRQLGLRHRQQTDCWMNKSTENSHLPFRRPGRAMLRFRWMRSTQKFAAVHASLHNHFNGERARSSRTLSELNRAAGLVRWRALCAE